MPISINRYPKNYPNLNFSYPLIKQTPHTNTVLKLQIVDLCAAVDNLVKYDP